MLVIILGLVGGVKALDAQERATGAASFIRLGSSARAIAMGRAYTALADRDALAAFWNPAGIAGSQRPRIAVTDRFMGDGELGMDGAFSFVSAGGSMPVTGNLAVGFGVMYYGVDGIEQYDQRGVYQGTFSDSEALLLLSLARLEGPMALGVNVKYISQWFSGLVGEVGKTSAHGIGLDVGLVVRFLEPVTLGIMLRNKTDLEYDRVPTSASVGIAYERRVRVAGMDPQLVAALDVEQVKDRPLRLHMGLGLERLISFQDVAFSMRLGHNNRFLEGRLARILAPEFRDELEGEDLVEPNVRWGIGIGIAKGGFNLDYTFSRGMLHDPNYLSLGYEY